jgi:hypothetical protein
LRFAESQIETKGPYYYTVRRLAPALIESAGDRPGHPCRLRRCAAGGGEGSRRPNLGKIAAEGNQNDGPKSKGRFDSPAGVLIGAHHSTERRRQGTQIAQGDER